MREPAAVTHSVTVAGLLRGRDLAGTGTLVLRESSIELATERGRVTIPLSSLEGVEQSGSEVVLYLATGDTIHLAGARALHATALELVRRGCTLPELTRSLRGFGSRRADAGPEHDRFFEPLLAARRRAEHASGAAELVAALDAAALRDAFRGAIGALTAGRAATSAPDRRALEAELLECADGLFVSLAALVRAQEALARSDDSARLTRWREWAGALQEAFAAADACWLAMTPVLRSAGPSPGRWRRWLGLSVIAGALSTPSTVAAAQHVMLRVTGAPIDSIRALGLDLVEAGEGTALLVADSGDRALIAARGWTAVPVFAPGASAAQRALVAGPTETRVYRSFDDPVRGVAAFLDSLARVTPGVHLDTIGRSVEGRPLIAVKIGARADDPARPNVLFMATYHAREWAATEMALRLVRRLATAPPSEARIDSLRSRRDIWVLPVANPDGYQYTFTTDRLWRKNRRLNGDGSYGVDMNRNHATAWARDDFGSSPNPTSEVYRGTGPESEPETRAIVDFHRAHPPVLAVSYHTYAGLLLFPWGHEAGKLAGDFGIFRALAGTDAQPAVRDRLPGSGRAHYRPVPAWTLYTANGEYTDWAYATFGAIAFTPELTSGYENGVLYHFEFPDDETRLETVFQDNLPFALDVLDAAADPLAARPQASGVATDRVGIESLAPHAIRVRVPTRDAAAAEVRAPARVAHVVDEGGGGRYTVRLLASAPTRAAGATVVVGSATKRLITLATSGAESGESGWVGSGFGTDTVRVAGRLAWAAAEGSLRSPQVTVPRTADSVSVLFWTRHLADVFSPQRRGDISYSVDNGVTWTRAGTVGGNAPTFYPERVDVSGVAGRQLVVRFEAAFGGSSASWWLDEIALVAHLPATTGELPTITLRPSENPVRGSIVSFVWPFPEQDGELVVYDFAGRRVWSSRPLLGASLIAWNVEAERVRNGVYLVVARGDSGRTQHLKLFVARRLGAGAGGRGAK